MASSSSSSSSHSHSHSRYLDVDSDVENFNFLSGLTNIPIMALEDAIKTLGKNKWNELEGFVRAALISGTNKGQDKGIKIFHMSTDQIHTHEIQ